MPVYFALALLGSTLSRKPIARLPAGSAMLTIFFCCLRLFLARFLRSLLLVARLDPSLLGLLVALLLTFEFR